MSGAIRFRCDVKWWDGDLHRCGTRTIAEARDHALLCLMEGAEEVVIYESTGFGSWLAVDCGFWGARA